MKSKSGFTIVELLIVIVVIAILAAITIVAFNGIQARARTTTTVSAVSGWAKALQLYKTENGAYPNFNSCLGDVNTYTNANNGVCYGTSTNTTWLVNTSFLEAMKPYLKNNPAPSNVDIVGTGSTQYRGAMYYPGGGYEIRVSTEDKSATCADISGLEAAYTSGSYNNGRMCFYKLP